MKPTPEQPLLVGILVDVSGSMMTSIENRRGRTTTRLESFRDSLEDLVREAKELSREGTTEMIAPLVHVFAYGFGFGNILSAFFGPSGPSVRDLLTLPGELGSTVPIDRLANNWTRYKNHVEGLASQMLGNTPMEEGFRIAMKRLRHEMSQGSYSGQPVLFVLSDGEPTDARPPSILRLAEQVQNDGVIIVSCYVTQDDLAEPRKLYAAAPSGWPPGAKLMLECASVVPERSAFRSYLEEYHWTVDPGGRLFTQVNQSETLSEFMSVVLSPLREQHESSAGGRARPGTRVFVSYSHQDKRYLQPDSLLGFLSGLERDGFNFWHDQRLNVGELWDEIIRAEIENADIALVLVSQALLNSRYCMDVEVGLFLQQRRESGLVIFPLILSPCDWKTHAWLESTQFEPRDGKSIARHYKDKGSRDELYLKILQQLREIGHAHR